MKEAFLHLRGKSYSIGDWLMDTRLMEDEVPTIIVDVFKDDSGDSVILRAPNLTYDIVKLSVFTELIHDEILKKIEKPLYSISQKFKNKFTQEYIHVLSISPSKSFETGEYHYFVMRYRPRFGDHFLSMKESEITKYFQTTGVESDL